MRAYKATGFLMACIMGISTLAFPAKAMEISGDMTVDKSEAISTDIKSSGKLIVKEGVNCIIKANTVFSGLDIEKDAVLFIQNGGSLTIQESTEQKPTDVPEKQEPAEIQNEENTEETDNIQVVNQGTIKIDGTGDAAFCIDKKADVEMTNGQLEVTAGEAAGFETEYSQNINTVLTSPYCKFISYTDGEEEKNFPEDGVLDVKQDAEGDPKAYACKVAYNPNIVEQDETVEEQWKAFEANTSVTVKKAALPYSGDKILTAEEGQTLNDMVTSLGEEYTFVESLETSVGKAGSNTFLITYSKESGKNPANYEYGEVTIQVKAKAEDKTDEDKPNTKPDDKTDGDKPNTKPDNNKVTPVKKTQGDKLADELKSLKVNDSLLTANGIQKVLNLKKTYDQLAKKPAEKKKIVSQKAKLEKALKKIAQRSCGKNAYYSFSNGTLTILGNGNGQLKDLFKIFYVKKKQKQVSSRSYNKYAAKITKIIVKDSISYVGNGSFAYMKKLKSVEFKGSRTSVGNAVFFGCSKLSKVTFSDRKNKKDTSYIGFAAFGQCSALKTIKIPEGVTVINNSVFYECKNLKTIELPSTLRLIGDTCFYKCKKLSKIVLKSNVKKCGKNAFYMVKKSCKITPKSKAKKSKQLVAAAKNAGIKIK